MNTVARALTGLIGLMVFSPVCSIELSPAHFGDLAEKFTERLSLPQLEDGDRMFVRCASNLSRRGDFTNAICYDNENQSVLTRKAAAEIVRITRFARIHPAIVDGAATRVWYNFSVLYRQAGSAQIIQVVDNHLYNAETYGIHYTSAQRYDKKRWYCSTGGRFKGVVTATISASAEITDISSPEITHCLKGIFNAIEQSKFIPATVEDKAVPSTYAEIFFLGEVRGRETRGYQ